MITILFSPLLTSIPFHSTKNSFVWSSSSPFLLAVILMQDLSQNILTKLLSHWILHYWQKVKSGCVMCVHIHSSVIVVLVEWNVECELRAWKVYLCWCSKLRFSDYSFFFLLPIILSDWYGCSSCCFPHGMFGYGRWLMIVFDLYY